MSATGFVLLIIGFVLARAVSTEDAIRLQLFNQANKQQTLSGLFILVGAVLLVIGIAKKMWELLP